MYHRKTTFHWRMALMLGCLTVSACQTSGPARTGEAADRIDQSLQQSFARVASALERLQRLESAAQGTSPVPVDVATAPPELQQRITWEWIGPIDGAVSGLAQKAGYSVSVAGPRPVTPLMVEVTSREQSLIELLQDIGLQASGRAMVRLDPNRRRIDVFYVG